MNPGIHNMPMAEYLADPCPEPSLSSSCAHRLLSRSPLHAWQEHPRLGAVGSESGVADKGSVAHDLLLGGEGKIAVIDPADFPAKNGNIPDGWTNPAIREARDAARDSGLTPILAADFAAIRSQVDAAREFLANSEIAGVLDRGQPEQTIIWREGDTWCRARPDWLTDNHDICLHFKTTDASAKADSFIRGIMQNMGYGFALRFYARGLAAVSDAKTQHLILVQEQNAPFACTLIGLTPAKEAVEDVRVIKAIETWRKCLAENRWPAYDTRVHWAEPTAWELAEIDAELNGEVTA